MAASDKPASPNPEYSASRIAESWRRLTTAVIWLLRYSDIPVTTVANLPSAASVGQGMRGFVTDSNATLATGHGNAVAGGGANKVPVYSDGSAWRIG